MRHSLFWLRLVIIVASVLLMPLSLPLTMVASTAFARSASLTIDSSLDSVKFPAIASVTLSPTFGPPTSKVKVNGTGYGTSETVTITFDTTKVGTTTTSSTGTFSKSVTVPTSAQPGNHTIKASGQTSGLSASRNFLVRTNWPQFGFVPQGGRYNNYENTISASNVSGLIQDWSAPTGGSFSSTVAGSPAVVNGVVYVGSDKLYAFKASSGTSVWSFNRPLDPAYSILVQHS